MPVSTTLKLPEKLKARVGAAAAAARKTPHAFMVDAIELQTALCEPRCGARRARGGRPIRPRLRRRRGLELAQGTPRATQIAATAQAETLRCRGSSSRRARWTISDRLTNFLLEQSPALDKATAPIIISGLQALKLHPLIGRQTERGLRELLISCGRTGYVALYEYHPATDAVLVLAVRHQRETRAC